MSSDISSIAGGTSGLPEHWGATTFGDIYELVYGKGLVRQSRNPEGRYPVFGSNGIIGYNDTYIVEGPAIIVGRKGAAGAISWSQQHCWPIDTTYFIRHCACVDLKFSYYLILNLRLGRFEKSTAIPGLSRDDVYPLPIRIPPLDEQRRIAAKIEELFSELDKGIESLKTAKEQLKIYRQAVLKHAFAGKLTAQWRQAADSPAWEETTLGATLSFLTSGSRGWAKYYSDDGDIFIRAQNLKFDRLDLDDVAYVRLPERPEGMRTQVRSGDLLITITGANVTKTGYVHSDLGHAYVSQHVALCRPIETVDTVFLYWYLIAECGGRKQLNEFAYGAGKPGLNLDNIRSVRICLPTLAEQQEIVGRIDRLLSVQETMNAIIDSELKRVEALRQSILKRAFSGQLVPQDPNDEPASVLLERIKAEKAAAATAGKRATRKQTA